MAEFERRAGTGASTAPASYGRDPAPVPNLLRESTEPMQRALDNWYRQEPEAFTRSEEFPAADEPASGANQAIALHHLLAYGRLAGERELERLRSQAANDGSPVLAPLVEGLSTRRAELLAAAPAGLRGAVEQGLAQSADRLKIKAATIESFTAERKRATSLEQSIALGEALLREDPDQYERLVADAAALTAALAPEPDRQEAMITAIRKRYAAAALEGELGPTGDPAHAAEDLATGRFRDAFDDDGIAAWRDLVTFQQQRRAAEAALAAQDAGIAAEAKLLTRLGAGGRGEAPLPSLAEIEAVFPGEGAKRLATAEQNRKRQLYVAQIALQPLDKDQAWIEAGDDGDDRLLRAEVVGERQQTVERGDWETLQRQYPSLKAAIVAGVKDPSKLNDAIELYQRQLAKLGVPPAERRLLPDEALKQVAAQHGALPAKKAEWLVDLLRNSDEERTTTILRELSRVAPDFHVEVDGLLGATSAASDPIAAPSGYPDDPGVYEELTRLHREGNWSDFDVLSQSVGLSRDRARLLFDILAVTEQTPAAAVDRLSDQIDEIIPEHDSYGAFRLKFALSELHKGHFNQDSDELRKTYLSHYFFAAEPDPDVGDPISDELNQPLWGLAFGLGLGASRRPRSGTHPSQSPHPNGEQARAEKDLEPPGFVSLNDRKISSFDHPSVQEPWRRMQAAMDELEEAKRANSPAEEYHSIKYNSRIGKLFEEVVNAILKQEGYDVQDSRYEYTVDRVKFKADGRIDHLSGRVIRIEAKSSETARLTPNQMTAYPRYEVWVFRLTRDGRLRVTRFGTEQKVEPGP